MAAEMLRRWREDGYVVVRGLLPAPQIEQLLPVVERVIAAVREREAISGNPAGPDATTMFHPNHPDYHCGRPADLATLLEIGADPAVLAVPRALFGEEPLLRCLSLWFHPTVSSREGGWHRDTQFLHPNLAEERRVFDGLVERNDAIGGQFQIALLPSDDIEVVPRSHLRWDSAEEFAIRRGGDQAWTSAAMPGATPIALEPGDAVVFDAKMLHRGRYHVDKPRRTFMVTTNQQAGKLADYFTRQPWFLEPGYLDGLSPAARRFYQRFIDEFAASWAPAASSGLQPA